MANRIDIRRWERTDKAQPVYKASVSLWEAPLYVAIGAAALASVCTPARGSFSVVHQTAPSLAWITQGAVDPVLATYVPTYDAQQASVRTADTLRIDNRHRTAPQSVYKASTTLFEAVIFPPIGDAQRASLRTPARSSFEVRHQTEPEPAWLFTSQPPVVTQAQLWPAIAPESFRVPARVSRDSRWHTADTELAWLQPILDRTVQTWIPSLDAQQASLRTLARGSLDVRLHAWDGSPAWIFTNLPAAAGPTAAQIVPALVGSSGRPIARTGLDVRFGFVQQFGTPDDATAPQQAAIWSQQANPGATSARPSLEVRRHRPDFVPTWIYATLTTGSGTALFVPPITQVLASGVCPPSRRVLDVRGWWFLEFGTPEPDATTTTLFRRGLTTRTGSRA